jgi:hypothetical protein
MNRHYAILVIQLFWVLVKWVNWWLVQNAIN